MLQEQRKLLMLVSMDWLSRELKAAVLKVLKKLVVCLIQAIRNITDLPIVAAGGIVDGRGMAAAFAAGAEGIQMGTRFVSCKESPCMKTLKTTSSILMSKALGY